MAGKFGSIHELPDYPSNVTYCEQRRTLSHQRNPHIIILLEMLYKKRWSLAIENNKEPAPENRTGV